MTEIGFSPELLSFKRQLELSIGLISGERKEQLDNLGEKLQDLLQKDSKAQVVFICTHNSRRSQLAEICFRLACELYDVQGLDIGSGGTEETAFNHRMVAALERAGFEFEEVENGANPKIQQIDKEKKPFGPAMYSKVFSDVLVHTFPSIAIMVCDSAAEACPFVPNASRRDVLLYIDPKSSDGTENERQAYSDKVEEIGREMLYLAKRLAP